MDVGGHEAGFQNLYSNPGGFWPTESPYAWYGPILVMSGVVFAYAAIEMVGVAAGEMEDSEKEVPKAVNAVIYRIGIFYCGSILLLVSILPTTEYTAGTSPFVTVFERLGMTWMSALIQAILIVAAMSSLNSGLYSTGRVLRSLGMSKQAPKFTLKMSSSGVPWAGIVMTSVVFVFGAVLNFLVPDAFELALEAAAIGVLFTWGTIFLCQLRLRKLVNLGVIPKGKFQAPGYPVHQLHRSGLPRAGCRRDGGVRLAGLPVLLAQDRLHRDCVRYPGAGDLPDDRLDGGQETGDREHRRPDQGGVVRNRPDLRG